MTIRHDAICDKIYKYCKKAGLDVEKEKRYEIDKDGNNTRVHGRPGDIKINNYFTNAILPTGITQRHMYYDATIVNLTRKSYLTKASKKRLVIGIEKELHKSRKYQNLPNIKGIGIEVFGGISPNGKHLFHHLACEMELRTNIHKSIHMNRIRSNILAELMQQNARMIIKCYNL